MSLSRSPFARDVKRVARHPVTRATIEVVLSAVAGMSASAFIIIGWAWKAGLL